MKTVRLLGFFFLSILVIQLCAQNHKVQKTIDDTVKIDVNVQRVLFENRDTSLRYTRYVNNYGEISFVEEYSLPNQLLDSALLFHSSKLNKIKTSLLIKHYLVTQKVDTLKNYFNPQFNIDFLTSELLYEMIFGSYILRESGLLNSMSLDDSDQILIILPYEEFKRRNYEVLLLKMMEDQFHLKQVTLSSTDIKGFDTISDEFLITNKRRIKKFNKRLSELSKINSTFCFEEQNPWILHTTAFSEKKYFYFSKYCSRNDKTYKTLKKIIFEVSQWAREYN